MPVVDDTDVMLSALCPTVTRHLPATGVRIDRRADGSVEHLGRRHAEHQAECASRYRVEPALRRRAPCRRREDRLVARAGDLKKILFWRLSPISLASRRRDV